MTAFAQDPTGEVREYFRQFHDIKSQMELLKKLFLTPEQCKLIFTSENADLKQDFCILIMT